MVDIAERNSPLVGKYGVSARTIETVILLIQMYDHLSALENRIDDHGRLG